MGRSDRDNQHFENERMNEMDSKTNSMEGTSFTVFRDITEKLQMDEQHRQTEMLNVLGELAAGIAHEIKNPLTSVKGFIQLLQGKIDGYSMYFNIMMTELDRIDSIINELLILAKPQAVQYKNTNIIKIMQETIELLQVQTLMDNVKIKTNFKHDDISFYCEPNHLKQVFINILKNAIEVSKKNSSVLVEISIETEKYIKISITDFGKGIPEQRLKKLGEPFYTTKERGTGLGLMVSFKIVKEYGGKINVESEVGKGTTFHIFLPIDQSNKMQD